MRNHNLNTLRRLGNVGAFAPQTAKIARHLAETGTITGVEAAAIYKCRSLPRRIKDIRDCGIKVSSEIKRDLTGQRYTRYTLD